VALQRIQIPSPNHSGGRPSNRLLVIHTSEGATTFRNLGNFLANPSSQVSYNCGCDDTSATEVGEYVQPDLTPWAAMAANSWGPHICCCTPSGASANWSRQDWLAHDNMLRACAAWLAEEAARYGVPLVKISSNDIAAGKSGVCGHGDCAAPPASAGGSHSDPGASFPWDVLIAYALGGADFPPIPAGPVSVYPRRLAPR